LVKALISAYIISLNSALFNISLRREGKFSCTQIISCFISL